MLRLLPSLLALLGCQDPQPAADASLRPVQTIPLPSVSGRIDHLAVDPIAQRLYVAALGNDTLEVIDLQKGERARSVPLGRPTGVALDPETGRFAVAASRDECCRVYDRELQERAKVEGFDDADNVRFDAGEKRFLVGYGDALGVFDASGEKTGAVEVGGHPESFQVEPSGDRVFVNVPARRAVVVVDPARLAVAATWKLAGASANYPMALDAPHHRLIVGCRRPAELVILDTRSGAVVSTVPCPGDADDLFCDPARDRVYVSGGAGRIDVFDRPDPDHCVLRGSVKTAPGARTCLYDPSTGRLYLAVPARSGQPAEIRVFEATT